MIKIKKTLRPGPASLVIIYHLVVVVLLYNILYQINIITEIPTNKNLVLCDAIWYNSIKSNGYIFIPFRTCNLAFFPLFPLVWKVLHVSPFGMAVINFCFFGVAFIYLAQSKEGKTPYFFYLFFLSVPSLIFFALPYSEAIFFACATVIIAGYRSRSTMVTNVGFFISSLARSVSMIFIPAMIITELLTADDTITKQQRVKRVLMNILSTLSGVFLAAGMQAYQTGKWFYFIEIQKFWKRHWDIPQLPLTTYSPDRILGIDAIAFIIGIAAIYYCIKIFFERYISKASNPLGCFNDRVFLFSILYLAGTTLLDVLFTFNYKGATSIWSLNRHIFCVPFVVVFLSTFLYKSTLSENEHLFFPFLIISGIYFTGVYKFPDQAFYYLLFFFCLFVMKYHTRLTPYLAMAYLLNIVLQVQFYDNFLKDLWIG